MEFVNIELLQQRKGEIARFFNEQKPFRYVVIENFFLHNAAEKIYNKYPLPDAQEWNATTYIDQRRKFIKNKFSETDLFNKVFQELHSTELIAYLQEISGISDLLCDPELFGAGLHQSITGAHLNVHIDYNIHPITKLHRRLNLIVYMNKDWKDEYEGHIEFWDYTSDEKRFLTRYAPSFNRCVIFETNEHSFHGHPKPLNTPQGINRKSLAVYYYTKNRAVSETAPEHNSVFINTEGISGQWKRFNSGLAAFIERIKNEMLG